MKIGLERLLIDKISCPLVNREGGRDRLSAWMSMVVVVDGEEHSATAACRSPHFFNVIITASSAPLAHLKIKIRLDLRLISKCWCQFFLQDHRMIMNYISAAMLRI